MFDSFKDGICESIIDCAIYLIELMFTTWNMGVDYSYNLLVVTPQNFKDGAPWSYITGLQNYFVAIGSSLLLLFFVYGFCAESINIRQDFNMENIIKMFIRFIIADAILVNSLTIMKTIFNAASALTILVSGGERLTLTVPDTLVDMIEQDWGTAIVALLLAFIGIIVASVLCIALIFTVYSRFFKLFVIIPLAPIGLAGLASTNTSFMATSYIKSLFAYSLEIVVIALALGLSVAMLSSGTSAFSSGEMTGIGGVVAILLEAVLVMGLTVGAVRGAENSLRKALGL